MLPINAFVVSKEIRFGGRRLRARAATNVAFCCFYRTNNYVPTISMSFVYSNDIFSCQLSYSLMTDIPMANCHTHQKLSQLLTNTSVNDSIRNLLVTFTLTENCHTHWCFSYSETTAVHTKKYHTCWQLAYSLNTITITLSCNTYWYLLWGLLSHRVAHLVR